ncbi:hypothetical protein B7486_55480, partial [cyanobacterium TDX16]
MTLRARRRRRWRCVRAAAGDGAACAPPEARTRCSHLTGSGSRTGDVSPRTTSAVVLAAGEGTRMRSTRPKPLHRLCGRAMVLYVLDAL